MLIEYRPMLANDWATVAKIYQDGIATGQATFERRVPSWQIWDAAHLSVCRLIAQMNNQILGWAALSPFSKRPVYAGVAEVSIYIGMDYRGQKNGTKLLAQLIAESEANGIWTLQAAMFPENKASVSLHKKLGFREVGYRKKIGCMNGIWRDTVLLERRSPSVGI